MAKRFLTIVAIFAFASIFAQGDNTEVASPEEEEEEVMSFPQDASQASSAVLGTIFDAISLQLHATHFQWVDALVALVVGQLMCFNGKFCFKYVLVGSVGLFSYLLTMEIVKQANPNFGAVLDIVVSGEVCALMSFIAYTGFDALRYLIGSVVGLSLAFYTRILLQHMNYTALSDNWAFIVFGSNICVLIGIHLFSNALNGHHRAMALIFSLVGACLVSSAFAYFLLLLAQHWSFLAQKLGCEIPMEQPFWVEHMMALCYPGTKTVGVWANCPGSYNHMKLLGMKWGIDRIVGRLVWFALFIAGYKLQVKMDKSAAEKENGEDKGGSKQEPLLG
jgi:hypothetical protein